jgi:hypothetical protein
MIHIIYKSYSNFDTIIVDILIYHSDIMCIHASLNNRNVLLDNFFEVQTS